MAFLYCFQVMHNIFPDNIYTDGNSLRCLGQDGTHTYNGCLLFSVSSNWIYLIERMPSMEKKGFIVLLFLLWNCPSFLGHRLWWMLECINEFPVEVFPVCERLSSLSHIHCMYYLQCPSSAALWRGIMGLLALPKYSLLKENVKNLWVCLKVAFEKPNWAVLMFTQQNSPHPLLLPRHQHYPQPLISS